MKLTVLKLFLVSILLTSSSIFFTAFASSTDVDELTNLLDDLLADEPVVPEEDEWWDDEWDTDTDWDSDGEEQPTTQSAEDIQEKLNEKEKSDNEMILDDEVGEDHDSAQDILDEDEKWMYAWGKDSTIAINNVKEGEATFNINKVLYDGNEVLKYRIYYSEKTLASQTLSLIKDSVVSKTDDPKDANMVQVVLKNLKPDTKYYVVVSPIHPEDDSIEPLEVITKEVNFKTKSTAPVEEPAEDAKEDIAKNDEEEAKEEPAAEEKVEPNKVYINSITNSVKDNEVTLRWAANEQDVDKVEVTLRHTQESKFTTIGTPVYKNGSFNFKVTKVWTYFLKLKALDKAGKMLGTEEYRSTVKVANITDPAKSNEAVVTNAPKVGPTTDLLLGLLIFSMIMYMVMRFRRIR